MRIRLVTWNIHSCVGMDGRYDPERIAEILRSFDADVIGLQEVDWRKPCIAGRDQFEFLARSLGMAAVEGPNLEDHRGHYGNGLLTRLRVDRVERLELAHRSREPRGLIDAHLSDDAHPLRVLVTHLGLSRRERRAQFRRIRTHLEAAPDPAPGERIVLLGDTNEWIPRPLAPVHGLEKWFASEFAPRTFPPRFPFLRLDRVLCGHGLRATAVRCTVKSGLASDHKPVCVEISAHREP